MSTRPLTKATKQHQTSLVIAVHNISTFPGTALAIDLFLPNNNRFRVISIYLPSNNKPLLTATHQKLLEWTEYANKHNLQLIILGDFNSNLERKDTTARLLHKLEKAGLQSILKTFKVSIPTWTRSQLESQIDDILIPQNILYTFLAPTILEAKEVTDSDHKVITIE